MRIVVVGGAANPVTVAHKEFVELLTHSGLFDLVVFIPSGARKDKVHLASSQHRAEMAKLTFSDEWQAAQPVSFRLDLCDVYGENTPTYILLQDLAKEYPNSEVTFATGVDVFTPLAKYGGLCEMEAVWYEGKKLFDECTFVIVPRRTYPPPESLRLPKKHIILEGEFTNTSSTMVRWLIGQGLPFEEYVTAEVAAYLEEHHLYQ